MRVVGGDREANLARAATGIAEAAKNGAHVVLLPEAMDLGWAHESASLLAEPIPEGKACQALIAQAKQQDIWICSGLVENEQNKIYNAAVLVSPAGEIILRYRKLNEVVSVHGIYDQGDRLGVAPTKFGTFGLMICSDGFAAGQVIARTLGYMGADIILSPSAWALPPDYDRRNGYGDLWRRNYKPVARDFRLWIASVSNVGTYRNPRESFDSPCIGNSLVIDPDGNEAVVGPFGSDAETILYADIALRPRPARACGWVQNYWKTGTPDNTVGS